jgi:hypothetical protein
MPLYSGNIPFLPCPFLVYRIYLSDFYVKHKFSKKPHSHLKVASGRKGFFCGKDPVRSYEGLMIRGLIKYVLLEHVYSQE